MLVEIEGKFVQMAVRLFRRLRAIHSRFLRTIENRKITKFDIQLYVAEQKCIFQSLGLSYESALSLTKRILGTRWSENLSQHYVLAAALVSQKGVRSILEIGTQTGNFSAFLASLHPHVQVTTIDLPSSDSRFNNAQIYDVDKDTDKDAIPQLALVTDRDKILSGFPNVTFREMNSIELTTREATFDLVFVDGDHTFPVVVIDAMNAIRMTKESGWIIFDDLRPVGGAVSPFGGSETSLFLSVFESAQVLEVHRMHKRLTAERLIDPMHRKQIALARQRALSESL